MSSTPSRPGLSADRPFPGLRPYRFEDRDFFFGRDDQIFSLYRLFDHSHFVAVVGSSGSGKSSLVRAGLLPLLDKESREPTGRSWKMIQMHPGDNPIGSLATAMARQLFPNEDANIEAARRDRIRFALRRSSFGISDALRQFQDVGDASIILVVDQFEELFRNAARQQGAGEIETSQRQEEAMQFVQVLLSASRDHALNVYVLLTMRSDFIGDCANFRGLPEAVSASQYLVPSLTRDQREEVIRRPIEEAGATIEPALVERLLNDSGDDIDQLPVLQHCLSRLWEQAGPPRAAAETAAERTVQSPKTSNGSRCLTTEQYNEIGGMSDALSKHANEVLKGLSDVELTVEQTFRSLAEIDSEGRIVRRARLFRELLAETGVPTQDLRRVVDRFRNDDCSFLTPPKSEVAELADDARIDVGHEALLRHWDRVSGDPRTGSPYIGWLRAEVADGRTYLGLLLMAESKAETIAAGAVEPRWKWWNERPRTAAWAKRYGGGIEQVQRLFNDSLASRDRQVADLRLARLLRLTAPVASVLLLLAIGVGVIIFRQRQAALQQKTIAQENLQISVSLATAIHGEIQQLLDSGQISVNAALKILTAANPTFAQFKAVEQTPAIMFSWATLQVSFADTYAALQDDKTALQYSQQAQANAKQLVAGDPSNKDYQQLLFSADYNCGDAEAGSSPDNSMQDYNAALSIAQNLAKNDPTNYVWMADVAFVMNKIGDTYDLQGHPSQALQMYQSALAINQGLADAHSNVDNLQRDLATALTRVGDAEAESGNPTDALAKYNSALTIRKTLANKTPGDAGLQSNLSAAYNAVAGVVGQQKNFTAASPLYDSALAIRRNLAKSDPSNLTWQSNLGYEYVYIGNMLMAEPDYAAAVDNYRDSLNIRDSLAATDPSNFTWLRNLADSHTKLAGALFSQGNLPDALAEHNAALPLRIKISAQFPDSPTRQRDLIDEYIAIGDISMQSDTQGATTQYQNALNVVQAFLSSHPGSTALDQESKVVTQRIQDLSSKNP
jgi:tetratricopeptide (TPR) repeat protein